LGVCCFAHLILYWIIDLCILSSPSTLVIA
jgi:hypothetical protein